MTHRRSRAARLLRAGAAVAVLALGAVACGDDSTETVPVTTPDELTATQPPVTTQPSEPTQPPATALPGARCSGTLSVSAGWPADAGEPLDAPLGTDWSPPRRGEEQVASWPGVLGAGVEVRWPLAPPAGDGDYEDEYQVGGMHVIQANNSFGSPQHTALVTVDAAAEPEDCRLVSVHAYGDDLEKVRSELRRFVENLTITVQ